MESTSTLSSSYGYIIRAFGKTIQFKRQPTGNPHERAMRAENFGDSILERLKDQDSALTTKIENLSKDSQDASTLTSLDKIFNVEGSSLEQSIPVNESSSRPKNLKRSKFAVIEEAKASEPYQLTSGTRNPGFKPPSSYDEEYDQGKLPKKRNKSNVTDKFNKTNMFQREQNLRNILEKKVKK